MAKKKIVIKVNISCQKCQQKLIHAVTGLQGIDTIEIDSAKSTLTVIGDADPVDVTKRTRKVGRYAEVVSVGPAKEEKKDKKDEKPDDKKDGIQPPPKTCQRCDVWYVIQEDEYNYCSIL